MLLEHGDFPVYIGSSVDRFAERERERESRKRERKRGENYEKRKYGIRSEIVVNKCFTNNRMFGCDVKARQGKGKAR